MSETEKIRRGDRTDDAELERRIREVERLILRGKSSSDIVSICDSVYEASERTARRYIAEANERIKESNKSDRELDTAKAKTRYERFIDLAEEAKELNVAVNAQSQLVKLLGLAEPDKQEVKHDVTDPVAALLNNVVNSPDQPKPRG
jgi:hypothetical protein